MRRLLPSALLLVMVAMVAVIAVFAAEAFAAPKNKVVLTTTVTPAAASPGARVTLRIGTSVPAAHWIYAPDSPKGGGEAAKIAWTSGPGAVPVGAMRFAPSHEKFDPAFKATVRTYAKTDGWFEQDFDVDTAAKPGELPLLGTLTLQICNDRTCTRETHPLLATVAIGAFDAAAVAGDTAADTAAEDANDVADDDEEEAADDDGDDTPSTPPATLATDRVTLEAAIEPATARAGEIVTLVLKLSMEKGQHTYAPDSPKGLGIPTTLSYAASNALLPEGTLTFDPGKWTLDPGWGEQVLFHTGTVTFRQPFRVPAGTAPNTVTLVGTMRGQACDDRTCDDHTLTFGAPLTIVAGAADPARASLQSVAGDKAASPPTKSDAAAASSAAKPAVGVKAKTSLGAFLVAAILSALLSLGTPCVFPMIPITVSVFSKDAGGSRARSVFLAIVYALGIVVTFTLFGVLTAVFSGAQGANAIASNGWVNLTLGTLFVVFAASLLGAFELRLPSFLVSGAAEMQHKRTGVVSVLLMGFVFTLTSFTCTVPIVGGLLVEAADGSYLRPILGMIAFSSTFALPFFLIALFPSTLRALPQAGGWMNAVKVTMGFLELAFAFKFLSNVDLLWNWGIITWPTMLTAWVAIFGVAALYLLGIVKTAYDDPNAGVGPYRLMFGVTFLSFSLYLASGFFGTKFPSILDGWLPPRGYGIAHLGSAGSTGESDHLAFHPTYAEAKAAAISLDRPLFLDFTGITCANCRAMENNVFPLPRVKAQLERYERAQLYVDGERPDAKFNADFQERMTGITAQPYYLILDPRTEEILGRFEGYANTDGLIAEFVAEVTRVADAWDAGG
ncbi:MAG: thioredoxin fold domain-containing protein [Planctomycetes bacterium]|nr:thioredoxin fold domain-containing protein [Planctomycetota bacterium]